MACGKRVKKNHLYLKIRLDDRNACNFRLVRIHEIEKTLPAPNQIQNLCSSHAPCIRTPPVGAREIREEIFYGLTYSSMIRRLLRTRNTKKKQLDPKKRTSFERLTPPPVPSKSSPVDGRTCVKVYHRENTRAPRTLTPKQVHSYLRRYSFKNNEFLFYLGPSTIPNRRFIIFVFRQQTSNSFELRTRVCYLADNRFTA